MSTDAPALREQQVLYGIVGDRIDRVTRRVPVDEPPPLAENAALHVNGERLPRLDAIQKVTGRARYTFDVQLPGMLYARRVVSTVPHARILDIDTSRGGAVSRSACGACAGPPAADRAAPRSLV